MEDRSTLRLQYSRVSEIPDALGKLSQSDLSSLLEARLSGKPAGLPVPQRDEDPADIILYAFHNADGDAREKLKQSLADVLDRQFRFLAVADRSASNGQAALLERTLSLIGVTGTRQALPTIRRALPFLEASSPAVSSRLVGCIASLAGTDDKALVPWLVEKTEHAAECRMALRALFRIHRPTAAAALPTVVRTLQSSNLDVIPLLTRVLALMLPSLSEEEQLQFLKQVESSLRLIDSRDVAERLQQTLDQVPGLTAQAQRLAKRWNLVPISSLPQVRGARDRSERHMFAAKPRRSLHGGMRKDIAVAHVERVDKLLQKLRGEKKSEFVIRAIERELSFLGEFQGQAGEDRRYYAQTLTQLAVRLMDNGLVEQAKVCVSRAREAAPDDPYPINVEIRLAALEGDVEKAQEVFDQALRVGLSNEVTYASLLDAYGKAGNVEKAQEVFDDALRAGLSNEITYNSLLDAYGKAGNVQRAQQLFHKAQHLGLVNATTYATMLDAYARDRQIQKLLDLFMEAAGSSLTFSHCDRVVLASILLKGLHAEGREDEIFDIAPSEFLDEQVLMCYSRLHREPRKALSRIEGLDVEATVARYVCRYRVARGQVESSELRQLTGDVNRAVVQSRNLSYFAEVALTGIESGCHRILRSWQQMYTVWDRIQKETLPRGPRINFLAGHGRDAITWALQNSKPANVVEPALLEGAGEVIRAFALQQTSEQKSPDILAAYGDVLIAFKEVPLALERLAPVKRRGVLAALQSRRAVGNEYAEDAFQVPPDEVDEIRQGRAALDQLLQMVA